ncbi:hypothetical protein C0J52_17454 [Blattella germanica]|nr:hypothetical protein C0J52_17454 [Blattella germanica]
MVYMEKPRTLEALAEAITREVREISLAMLDGVWIIYPLACNNAWTRMAATWMMSFFAPKLQCNIVMLYVC